MEQETERWRLKQAWSREAVRGTRGCSHPLVKDSDLKKNKQIIMADLDKRNGCQCTTKVWLHFECFILRKMKSYPFLQNDQGSCGDQEQPSCPLVGKMIVNSRQEMTERLSAKLPTEKRDWVSTFSKLFINLFILFFKQLAFTLDIHCFTAFMM